MDGLLVIHERKIPDRGVESLLVGRQHSLEGEMGRGAFKRRPLRRWQIDVTSGARVRYLIDPEESGRGQKRRSGQVIIDQVHPGHPKNAEKKPSGQRRLGRRCGADAVAGPTRVVSWLDGRDVRRSMS